MCGGLHVTTFDPDLQTCFAMGSEMMAYRTNDDLYDTVKLLLAEPDRMQAIRDAAHVRAHRDHTWEHRLEQLFSVLGVMEPAR